MFNKHFLATMVAVLPFYMAAQFTISGTVRSKKQESLAGAVIHIKNTYIAVSAKYDGKYEIKSLKEGKYYVITSLLGYKNRVDSVELKSNTTVDIELEENSVLMDEVQVVSTRADNSSALAYTNLDKTELNKQNLGQDLPYLLNLTPSVVVTSDAGAGVGYTGIRIRGTDATRINTTINGVPVNDAESQGTYWVDLPDIASSTDNIQIQRGVGTSTNGAGAFGGSLNLQTTKLNEKAYADVSNSYGSFNTHKHTINVGTGLMNDHWTIDTRLSKVNSDGYIERAASDLKSYYLSGAYYGKSTIIKAIMFSGFEKTYQAWYGVPEDSLKTNRKYNPAGEYIDLNGNTKYYDNQTDNYQQDYYQLHLSQTINTSWNFNSALHYTKGKGYYEEYKQGETLADYKLNDVVHGIDTIKNTDLIRRKWLDNDFYGFIFSFNYNSNKKLSATIGGGWNEYRGKHYGEIIWAQYASNGEIRQRYYEDAALKNDMNMYAKTNYKINNQLNIFVDLQFRKINYSFLGFNSVLTNVQQRADLNFFNPKAGLSYYLDDKTLLYASYSVGNKEPNRDDYTQSSPISRPKAERLNDIETGIRYSGKKTSWSANYYYMNYKDQLVLTGQINDVGSYIRTNIPTSYRAGLELEFKVKPVKWTEWAGNATFSKNKIKLFTEYVDDYDNGNQKLNLYANTDIAFSPNVILASNIAFIPVENLSIHFITKHVGKQYLDNTSNSKRMLDSYLTNDVRINYAIKVKGIRSIDLIVSANNIFGAKYSSNGYTYSYFASGSLATFNYHYPQALAHYLVGVVLKF